MERKRTEINRKEIEERMKKERRGIGKEGRKGQERRREE